MKYEIVIDEVGYPYEERNTPGNSVVLIEFDNEEDAKNYLSRLNNDIENFYGESTANHGWSDWKIEELREEYLGHYPFLRELWERMDPYTGQNKAYIKSK